MPREPRQSRASALVNLRVTVDRIKGDLKRKSGTKQYLSADGDAALLTHLKLSNVLDVEGEIVMGLGARVMMSSGKGQASTMGSLPSAAEALLQQKQGHLSEYDSGWLDEELAITEGPNAVRKARGDCGYANLLASVEIRERWGNSVLRGAQKDRLFIDQHPKWQAKPEMTMAEVLGVTDEDDEPETA